MFFVVLIWKLLFAWCVAARDLGWIGYGEVLISVGVLLAALVYLWKVGALDWAREPHRIEMIRVAGV